MNNFYIITETSYSGPAICFEFGPTAAQDIADCYDRAHEKAFEYYRSLPDNHDVPDAELYTSIFAPEASSFPPLTPCGASFKI